MDGPWRAAEALFRAAAERPEVLAQILALGLGALLVLVVARARGMSDGLRTGVMTDAVYVASRAFATLPLTIALLAGLGHLVATYAPALQLGWLPGQPWWVQVVVYVVLMDALAYVIHRAFHSIPLLWRFHAIHHSQPAVNPFTTTRTHLVELLVKRVLTWAPLAILGQPTVSLALFVVLDGFWGFFVHSGLRVPLGPLRYLIVEPRYHLLHHSRDPAHHGANFAERLVVWDLLLGSARFEESDGLPTGVDDPHFPMASDGRISAAVVAWFAQLIHPFRRSDPE